MYERYIGREVEMVYQDRNGKFTQRRIHINSILDGTIRAICTEGFRTFKVDNVLAMLPVIRRAG